MSLLNIHDVVFESSSVVDPVGRVFHYDGRIFRAITEPYADFVRHTIGLANQAPWFEVGLVRSWLTEYTLPGYPLVVEHQRVPFVTLRGEWSGEGLRAAALCLLRVSASLIRSGLCIKDAHTWNVLFDKSKPVFVDWGSIRPMAELHWGFWYEQFRQYVLAPLYLFSIGEHSIARAMLREHKVGVGNELIQLPIAKNFPELPRRIASRGEGTPTPEVFEELVGYVMSLHMPRVEGEWSNYAQPSFGHLNALELLREKDRIVHRILADDAGKSLIDIGTNNGLHSEIAAALGKSVLACDIEESCLNSLFLRSANSGVDVLPLYLDFLWPMGSSGIFNSIPSAHDRLRCDTALVMAVTHHLVFKHHVTFESMAKAIRSVSRKRAIVEFVPSDDQHVALWSPERFSWYTLENFIVAMRRHFSAHTILPSEPNPRCVVIFEDA